MSVRVGPRADLSGPRDKAHIQWLHAAPVIGPPDYPVVLDVAEACARVSAEGAIREACRAIAPAWEELVESGLARPVPPSPEDVANSDNTLGAEHYLTGTVARAAALLGLGYGAVIRSPERFDGGSAVFIRRLAREAQRTGFELLVDSRPSRFAARYADISFEVLDARAARSPHGVSHETARILALCPQGIPAEVLMRMGCDLPSGDHLVKGPDGAPWAFLTPAERRSIIRRMAPASRAALHARIFDAWPPDGWGYLRRAPHARRSGDPSRMLAIHRPYVLGIGPIGSDFLYSHYLGLLRLVKRPELRASAYPILVCAGRLAPRVRAKGGFPAAARYNMGALKHCTEPAARTMLHYEIANNFTLQRNAAGYAAARRWYAKGYRELEQVPEGEAHLREEIRLHNGLALVEYHQANDDAAMRLEQEAARLSAGACGRFPELNGWAKPLLNFNTAKLFAKRFANESAALELLEQNALSESSATRETALMEIARIHWARRDLHAVSATLGKLYSGKAPEVLDEQQEIEGRLMLCLSLAALQSGEKLSTALPELEYLTQVAGSPKTRELSALLAQCASTLKQSR